MATLTVWAVGITSAVFVCHWLWKGRRDAEVRRNMAARVAEDAFPELPDWPERAGGGDGAADD